MKYSITYFRSFRYMKDVDEIILYWSTEDNIVDFVLENFAQKQRIVIDFSDKKVSELRKAVPKLLEMKEKHSNFTVKMNIQTQKAFSEFLYDKKIPFFFGSFCNNWDSLYAYGLLGVSDVYITEELCFNLKDVKAFCEPRRIKVRVFPNVAQVSGKGTSDIIPDIKKFFIRPEDICQYEPYVDICELWCPLEKQSVLYEIYKSEQWLGDLSDIISSFETSVPNTGFMPHFAALRINCKKKCYKTKCDICPAAVELAHMMIADSFEIQTPRELVGDRDRLLKELKENEEKQKEAEQELEIEGPDQE